MEKKEDKNNKLLNIKEKLDKAKKVSSLELEEILEVETIKE